MVPPDTDEVRVIDCPESIVDDVGVTVGVASALLTVTVSDDEHMELGVVAESVTLYE